MKKLEAKRSKSLTVTRMNTNLPTKHYNQQTINEQKILQRQSDNKLSFKYLNNVNQSQMVADHQSMYSYLTINSVKEIKSQVKRIKDQCSQAKKAKNAMKNTKINFDKINYNKQNQFQTANALITKLTNNSPNVKVITREYKTNIKMKKFLNCLEQNVLYKQKRLLQQQIDSIRQPNSEVIRRKSNYSSS